MLDAESKDKRAESFFFARMVLRVSARNKKVCNVVS